MAEKFATGIKPTTPPSNPTKEPKPSSVGNLTRKGSCRGLPKWMNSPSKGKDTQKKKRFLASTKKSPSAQFSSVYVMSEAELTDYARLILEENNVPCPEGDSEPGAIIPLLNKLKHCNPVSGVTVEGNIETDKTSKLTKNDDRCELKEIDSKITLDQASIEEENYIDNILESKVGRYTLTSYQNNSKTETFESQSHVLNKSKEGVQNEIKDTNVKEHVDSEMAGESRGSSEKQKSNLNQNESEHYLDTLPMFNEDSLKTTFKSPPKRKLASNLIESKIPKLKYLTGNTSYLDELGL